MAARHGNPAASPMSEDLVITRVFDAPPEAVWKAWTDPRRLVRWYGMPGEWPSELLVTVTFENDGGKTIMTLNHSGIPSGTLGDCEEGWSGSFDKLAESLR